MKFFLSLLRQVTAQARFTRRLGALAWLLPVAVMAADGGTAAFEQANKLYEQGKFAEAATAYEKMIAGGQASTAVYFNLGNAFFKDGQLGRAILNYRRAEWLSPRDPDLLANLAFARKVANGGTPEDPNYWQQFIGKLNLNEWTVLTMTAWWLWLIMLGMALWEPKWKTPLRTYRVLACAGGVCLTIFAWAAARDRLETNPAVVTTKEAVIRYGPLPESRSFFTLHDGAELRVLDQKGEWLQVADSAQRIGWLKQDQVTLLRTAAATTSTAPPGKPST